MNRIADAIALKLTRHLASVWREAVNGKCSNMVIDEAWRLVVTGAEREWGVGTKVHSRGTDVIVEKGKMYEVLK